MKSRPTLDDETLHRYLLAEGMTELEMAEIAQRLSVDASARERLAAMAGALASLQGTLRAQHDAEPTPESKLRWQQALERAEAREHSQRRTPKWSLALGACFAAACAWLLLPMLKQSDPVHHELAANQQTDANADSSDETMRAFAGYAREARQVLLSIDTKASEDTNAVLADLLAQHVLVEQLAEIRGRRDVARLLRAMRPLLASLSDRQASESADLKAGLITQLEFEYAALLTKSSLAASKQELNIGPNAHQL
jgi:type VI protein secretion system component VasF